ncbi:hypothetical protein ACFL09_01000 [Planctomycetota bacterium]
MSRSEQKSVLEAMEHTARGDEAGKILEWDPGAKQIRVVSHVDPDGNTLRYTPEDLKQSGRGSDPVPRRAAP